MARKNAQPETANEPHPALAILEAIEAKLKPLGDLHRHDAAWVKAKLAEAKSHLK